jgi:methionyl-tRNA formyltransferase
MRIGLLCSSPVVFDAMAFLFETGSLAGVASPSEQIDFAEKLVEYSKQYKFPFNTIDTENIERDLTEWLKTIDADVVFVFMFPKRIPSSALQIPKYGFVNFHGGKLPQYRSPVPDFWTIRNGEKKGTLTAHFMDGNFDAGTILNEVNVTITENETSGTLISKFGRVLSFCMEQTIAAIEKGSAGIVQDESHANFYKRPNDADLSCNFLTMNAKEVHSLVCAAIPRFKGGSTKIGNRPVRILQTSLLPEQDQPIINPGVIVVDRVENELWIGCNANTSIRIDIVDLFEGVFTGYRFAEYSGLRSGEIVN